MEKMLARLLHGKKKSQYMLCPERKNVAPCSIDLFPADGERLKDWGNFWPHSDVNFVAKDYSAPMVQRMVIIILKVS